MHLIESPSRARRLRAFVESALSGWLQWLLGAGHCAGDVLRDVEHVVGLVDPRLRLVSGYAKRLVEPVERLDAHARAFARRVPGPIEVSRRAYGLDPRVHALFGGYQELPRLFGRLHEQMAAHERPRRDIYALLCARGEQKSVLGVDMQGELIRHDVLQVAVSFKDHTVLAPSGSEAETRDLLARCAFESMARRVADEFDSVRAELARMQAERDALRSQWRLPRPDGRPRGGAPIDEDLRRLHAQLELPARLERLAQRIGEPERLLRIESTAFALTRLNLAAEGDPSAAPVRLPQIIGRDRRRWAILLVRYPVAELPSAPDR